MTHGPDLTTPRAAPAPRDAIAAVSLIFAAELVVFLVGLRTPIGLSEWTFFLAPLVACVFFPHRWLPFAAAVAATIFIVLGYFLAHPTGLPAEVAVKNRAIGVTVIWIVTLMAWRSIALRLHVDDDRWLKEGHTQLGEAVRSERDPRRLADRAVSYICGRAGAQVGALFVSRGGGPYELAGGFALAPERVRQRPTFHEGESLVGQAARERRLLRVGEVPAGYADVSSGVGAAAPRHLLLAPVFAEGAVKGVLELGFMAAPGARQEAFVALVSETLGAAVQAVDYQQDLQELLGRSRAQTTELEAQRAELRAVNQDLEMQSAALQRSQGALEEQQAELERANRHLEEQANALQEQRRLLEDRNDELRRAHEAMAIKAEQLADANRYKSDFLANMSHELRTPLNSTLILSRMLADNKAGNLSPEQVRYAETIQASGTDLLRLINEVLDLSKVEAGKLELLPGSFALLDVVSGLERSFLPVAEQKGLRLEVALESPDVTLHTDRGRLEQILRNLLSNAIKFTEAGEVRLRVWTEGDQVSFQVRDTGIGIAREHLERIFEAFHQADRSISRRFGGTGLGLSISQRFAALMGGRIRVESAPGEGSEFTLVLPRRAPEPTPATRAGGELPAPLQAGAAPAAASPAATPRLTDDRGALDPSRRTVLVVEDDERFAFVLQKLVHETQLQCLVATTAAEGLALADRHQPAAIVLDVKLPDQSGLAVLEQLKASPRTRHIPIHVLSILDHAKLALELGAVSYLVKPVPLDDVVEALSGVTALAARARRSLLLVEDDRERERRLTAMVAHDGVAVTCVRTADEALALLDREAFDCVVLDLELSSLSAFGLLETLAAEERFSRPPVIVYSERDVAPAEEVRLRRYARTVVLKGARSPERLLDEVTLFLHRVEERLPAEQQAVLADLRSRDRSLAGRRLLLVDDDVRNVYALTSVLEEQQARVRIARNGREALDELERDPAVDLVLMDLMMPVMDGYQAIAAIREQERFRDLPIVALTASVTDEDHDRCLRAGADDYLTKPVEVGRLVSLLLVWLARRRSLLS